MLFNLNSAKSLLLVFIISLLICLLGIGSYPIYILDEAKNAEAAREMKLLSEYIIPTFNNILRTDKPPLHYYFMQLGYTIFGTNAFGARFFSSIFGALTFVVSFYFIKKHTSINLAYITLVLLWSAIFFCARISFSCSRSLSIFFY